MHYSEIFNNYAQGAASIIGSLALAIGGAFGLYQFKKDLSWRKTELGRQLCKSFIENKDVYTAMQLLMTPGRTLSRMRDEQLDDEFAKGEIKKALTPGNNVQADKPLYEIARVFEAFLDGLCELEHHRRADLINESTIKSYIGYWLNILSGAHAHRRGTVKRLQYYSRRHGFLDALWLCKNCGYPVRDPWSGDSVPIEAPSNDSVESK